MMKGLNQKNVHDWIKLLRAPDFGIDFSIKPDGASDSESEDKNATSV